MHQIASLFAKIGLDTSGLERGLKESKSQLQSAGKDIEKVGKQADTSTKGLGGLGKALSVAGALGVAAKFGKTAYELGMMGAEAERASATFQRVAGGSAEAALMLDTLKTATMGTRSELELMNSATTLMALGLGETADDIGSIMRSVEGLGARFGGTMQTFQLMMSNDSLMRIDSFGIGVEEATKRIDEFKAAGMDAGEAFDTAILELMNEKFNALGGNIEDNITKAERLGAIWVDFKSGYGASFADGVGGASEALAGFLGKLNDGIKLQKDFANAYPDFEGSFESRRVALAKFAAEQERQTQAQERQNALGGATVQTLEEYTAQLHAAQAASFSLEDQTYSSLEAWQQYTEYSAQSLQVFEETRNQLEETAARVNNLRAVMGAGLTEGLEDAQADLVGLREEAGSLEGAIGELEEMSYRTPAQEEELSNLKGQLGDVQGEIDGVISKAEEMAGAFVMSALEAQISADGMWSQSETDLFAHVGQQLGMFDEIAAGMISATSGAVDALNEGSADVTEATNMIIEPLDKVVERYTTIGETGAGAMGEIDETTGSAVARMIDLGIEAEETQAKIDAMHGKTISMVLDVLIKERRAMAATAYTNDVFEDMQNAGYGMEQGGQFWTNGPTPLIVGEGGESEFVSVIPKSDMMSGGYGVSGASWTGDIIIQGVGDPDATAAAVIRKLQDRGLLRSGGFR